MNLYEINAAYEEALNRAMQYAEEYDGVLSDEISAELERIEITRAEKIENTACLIKNIEAEAEAIRAEEKRLADRRKSLENRAGSVREWLQVNLHGEKYTSARASVSYRKCEAVELTIAPDDLPEYFKRVKTTVEADKTAIKTALKAGHEVEGAELVSRESIVIR